MKRLLLLFFVFVAFALSAQDAKDEMHMIQLLFGDDKDQIVNQFVKVEGANKERFQKLYSQFEKSRSELGQRKFALLNNYVKSYNKLNEKELDEVMIEIQNLNASHDKLMAEYYKKVKKECGITVAAQFYQIEWYLLSQIRTTILESIPVLNELDDKK